MDFFRFNPMQTDMNDKMFAAVYIESIGSKKRWEISKSFMMEGKNMKNLVSGSGFDTYLVSDRDIINDIDYSGLIILNYKPLSGKKTKVDGSGALYEDGNFLY